MAINQLDATNFKEMINSDKPIFVDFWADWCGPCKMIEPFIEEIANELEDKIEVGKLDVDAYPAIAQEYSVFSIPTMILFKNGQAVATLTGARPKQDIVKFIQDHTNN